MIILQKKEMKANILLTTFLGIVFFFPSCSHYAQLSVDAPDKKHAMTLPTNSSVGINAIREFAAMTKGPSEVLDIIPYTNDSDTLFFLLNYTKGWKIISNDIRTQPVLAASEDGHITLDELSGEDLEIWLQAVATQYKQTNSLGISDEELSSNIAFWCSFPSIKLRNRPEPVKTKDAFDSLSGETYQWKRTLISNTSSSSITNDIPHLVNALWGQGEPWNIDLEFIDDVTGEPFRLPTGCAPVAIAELFHYLHSFLNKPNGLYHDHILLQTTITGGYAYFNWNFYNYQSNSTRWSQMPLWSLSASDETAKYVSDLMLHIGYLLGQGYSIDNSYVPSINGSVFSSYGIQYSTSSYNTSTVRSSILSSLPVLVKARRQYSSTAHAWLIDGLIENTTTNQTSYIWERLYDEIPYSSPEPGVSYYTDEEAYYMDPALYDGKVQIVTTSYSSCSWRMNWGADGAYYATTFATGGNWNPDNSTEGPFNTNIQIFYNFH